MTEKPIMTRRHFGRTMMMATFSLMATHANAQVINGPRTRAAPSISTEDPGVLQLIQQAQPISCIGGTQRLSIPPNTSGKGRGRQIVGMCLQVINKATGVVIWEGLTPSGGNAVNFRRLPYSGGGLTIKSKQSGLLSSVVVDNKMGGISNSYIVRAQLQAGVFGDLFYESGAIKAEILTSLYDPVSDTHTWSPQPLPNGCGPWTERAPVAQPSGAIQSSNPFLADFLSSLSSSLTGMGGFFGPYNGTLTAPPSGSVLGYNYVKTSTGRCWLGGAGAAVAGLPVQFSWGATLPLSAAYEFRNGQLVDVEEADSAALEGGMLAMGFNPGQTPMKYTGNAVTDANGNFAINYNVEKVGVGPISVLRRGYRLSSIHKTQGGFRLWQRIDPSSPKKPNKTGECLVGKAVVASDGSALDITYGFKGASC